MLLLPPAWVHGAQLVGLGICAALVIAFLVTAWRARISGARALDFWTLAALTTVVASPHLLVYDLLIAVVAELPSGATIGTTSIPDQS